MDKLKYENPIFTIFSTDKTIIYYNYQSNVYYKGRTQLENSKSYNWYFFVIPPILLCSDPIIQYLNSIKVNRYVLTICFTIIMHFVTIIIFQINWKNHLDDNKNYMSNLIQIDEEEGRRYAVDGKSRFAIENIVLIATLLGCVVMAIVFMLNMNVLFLALYGGLYLIFFFLAKGFKPIKKYTYYKTK